MKAFLCKLSGTFALTLGVGTIVSSFTTSGELTLLPWPVALVVIALGVFVLRQGGGFEGWTDWSRRGAPCLTARSAT